MPENSDHPDWIDRYGRSYHTTGNEIEFLNDIPDLMAQRAGTLYHPRKQSDSLILSHYRKYLKACGLRRDWGTIEKGSVQAHCKKLILVYAKRLQRKGYGF